MTRSSGRRNLLHNPRSPGATVEKISQMSGGRNDGGQLDYPYRGGGTSSSGGK